MPTVTVFFYKMACCYLKSQSAMPELWRVDAAIVNFDSN